MNKSRYTIPTIKVKLIDNEEILAGTVTQTTYDASTEDDGGEAGSKSTSMFDTDNDDSWK